MKAHTDSFTVATRGKGTYEITEEVARVVRASGVATGLVTVFLQHTSASLVIYENADPSARADLHEFFERLVPEDQPYFIHTDEGSDDMQLGTWQGIFLFEHRRAPHRRTVSVSVLGV
jgi:secondary thiamine-phosphate synthase enzyme